MPPRRSWQSPLASAAAVVLVTAVRVHPALCQTAGVVDASGVVTLQLEPASVTNDFQDGNVTRYPESHFLDWVVDGKPMRSVITGAEDMVTELNRPWLAHVPASVDVLLGRAPSDGLLPGRVPLWVCSVCGDYDCGVVTARIDVCERTVAWSEFRGEAATPEVWPLEGAPESLVFDRDQYEQVLAGAYERLAALPFDELAHHGRGFLWPWQWGWRLDPKP